MSFAQGSHRCALVVLTVGSFLLGCSASESDDTSATDASTPEEADAQGGGHETSFDAAKDALADREDAALATVRDATTADAASTDATDAASADAAASDGPSRLDATIDGASLDAQTDDALPLAEASTFAASDAGDGGCAYGAWGEAIDLSCGSLYSDIRAKTVASDALAYDPGLHLWSDGADKSRWIQLPAGEKIDTSNVDQWAFPAGTKFWKEFSFGGKRVETRLLWKVDDFTWYMTTYAWNADQSSAVELTTGEANADGNGYEIPPRFACPTCHDSAQVLGFSAISLATSAAKGQTLSVLASEKLITNSISPSSLTIPGTAPEAAALGYLHINCGVSCHNPDSATDNHGFFMRLDSTHLGSVQQTDTYTTGWNAPSQGFLLAKDRLEACNVAQSAVYYRMTHRDGLGDAAAGIQMPPIATHKVDDAGAALITAWVNEHCPDAGRD